MFYWRLFLICIILPCLLSACHPMTRTPKYEYKLDQYSSHTYPANTKHQSLFINKPTALAGYNRTDMLYVDKPYALTAFAYHAWVDTPADMLLPLIMQSVQAMQYFDATASSPIVSSTSYRLDNQLLELHQSFMQNPSVLYFSVKVTLTRVADNQIIASTILQQAVNCPKNTPYGGVIAANQATKQFTAQLTKFIYKNL